jgi:Ca-activated chloride channel family protein
MRFLDPAQAVWLLALPLAASFWLLYARARRRFRADAAPSPVMRRLSRLSGKRRDAVLLAITLAAIGLFVLAAMRPRVRYDGRVPEYERQDVILILDRSASMLAQDVAPSRFARAIDEVKVFLARKPEGIDRVALVAFAGTSLTVSHLTRDTESLYFFLDWIREDATLHFGTDVAAALGAAREVARRDRSKSRKIFLLLSDGDDHGPKVAAMLEELRRERVRVHAIGIGTPREMPIPVAVEDGVTRYLEDEQGQLLLTRFDPTALREVAGLTGGRFVLSTTGHELAPAMEQIALGERRQVGWRRSHEERDAHRPLLLAAAAAVLLLLVRA